MSAWYSYINMKRGFTLIELLVVVTIIGILSTIVTASLSSARNKARYSRALGEFRSISNALELYYIDNGEYPPDVYRDIPPGLGTYLAGEDVSAWPQGPWNGSMYDWDYWEDIDYVGQKIYQISIRFCPLNGVLADCTFPDDAWAEDFDVKSSLYYCVDGACRAHFDEDLSYPGLCVNC